MIFCTAAFEQHRCSIVGQERYLSRKQLKAARWRFAVRAVPPTARVQPRTMRRTTLHHAQRIDLCAACRMINAMRAFAADAQQPGHLQSWLQGLQILVGASRLFAASAIARDESCLQAKVEVKHVLIATTSTSMTTPNHTRCDEPEVTTTHLPSQPCPTSPRHLLLLLLPFSFFRAPSQLLLRLPLMPRQPLQGVVLAAFV